MADKRIGLYVGAKSVGVVCVDRKGAILNQATFEFSSIEEEAQVETLQEDIRWEALINKTLREASADGKEVLVSLTDKDFIYRSLEMPMMAKREIESSVLYEIEKYIPFKLAELAFDYDYITLNQERKISLSFVGIKNNDLQRINNILSRLSLRPVKIEPASLSLAKIIASQKNYLKLKNFAILDFTDNESYLTFFYQNLPVFNRYLTVTKKDSQVEFDKFMESVRLSFQYFKREFRLYELEKFIVIGNTRNDTLRGFVKEELQVEPDMVTASELSGNPQSSVETLKALGITNTDIKKYKFEPIIKKIEESAEKDETVAPGTPIELGKLILAIIIGSLLCFFTYLVMATQVSVKENEVEREKKNLEYPAPIKDRSLTDLQQIVENLKADTAALQDLAKSAQRITPVLLKLARVLPSSAWLDSLEITAGDNKNYTGTIGGNAFNGNSSKERAVIDDFLSKLNSDSDIKNIFKVLHLASTEQSTQGGFSYTKFIINLE